MLILNINKIKVQFAIKKFVEDNNQVNQFNKNLKLENMEFFKIVQFL